MLDEELIDPPEFGEEIIDEEPVDVIAGLLELAGSINLVDMLTEERIAEISMQVVDETAIDEASREDWLEKARDGMELASMVAEVKSTPWHGAPNVKYPLIAQAALEFWSTMLPAILPGGDVVKAKVHGKDRTGKKAARTERVSGYMSHYLRKKTPEWSEDTSKLMMQLPVVGHLFRKVWYDPASRRARSKLCAADGVIVNQATRHLSEAPRITELLHLYPNEIEERERDGRFRKHDYSVYTGDREGDESRVDGAEGVVGEDSLAPQEFYEQHRWLDLDEDGYSEPYIVTVHKESKEVVRIVANFLPKDVMVKMGDAVVSLEEAFEARAQMGMVDVEVRSIKRREYFQDYRFLPSFDGTYYGIGLGFLLNHTSRAINTTISMLMAGGQLSTLGLTFLGQGPNLKKGVLRIEPGKIHQVNTAGATLRDSIVQMQFPEPSQVLFAMLGSLIEAGRDVGQVRDVLSGENVGANASPTTVMAVIQQGQKVHTAITINLFQYLGREFHMLAEIIALDPDERDYAKFNDIEPQQPQMMGHNGGPPITARDDLNLDDMDIEPIADPRSVTSAQKMGQGQLLLEMSRGGDFQRDPVVSRRVVEAAGVSDLDELFPEPTPEQQQAAMAAQQLQMRAATAEVAEKEAGAAQKMADAEEKRAKTAETAVDGQAKARRMKIEEESEAAEIDYKRAQTAKIYHELKQPAPEGQNDGPLRLMIERERIGRERDRDQQDAAFKQAELALKRELGYADLDRKAQIEMAKLQNQPATVDKPADPAKAIEALQEIMTQMRAEAAAPRRVLRDAEGNMVGVETVRGD